MLTVEQLKQRMVSIKKYGLVLKLGIRKSSYWDLELNPQVLGAVHGVVTKFLILPTYSMQRKRLNDGA
jgi:hypothetical protein